MLGKKTTVDELIPSSESIKYHIERAFIATYNQFNILNTNCKTLDPSMFGFIKEESYLLPKKVLSIFPPIDDLIPIVAIVLSVLQSTVDAWKMKYHV